MTSHTLFREINEWLSLNDIIPSDWEEVIFEYIADTHSEEEATHYTKEVLNLFGV